jgi:hypothetical protein
MVWLLLEFRGWSVVVVAHSLYSVEFCNLEICYRVLTDKWVTSLFEPAKLFMQGGLFARFSFDVFSKKISSQSHYPFQRPELLLNFKDTRSPHGIHLNDFLSDLSCSPRLNHAYMGFRY